MLVDEYVPALKMLMTEVYVTSSCLLDAALLEAAGLHIIEA